MKRVLFIFFGLFTVILISGQIIQEKPSSLPSLDIVRTNGIHFRLTDIQTGVPAMLVYFDPDCDHCDHFIDKLADSMEKFSSIQIIMVTFVPVSRLQNYIVKKGLQNYPNVVYGTEEDNFTVRYHYHIFQFPYVALHDSMGKLIASFESDVPDPVDLVKMMK